LTKEEHTLINQFTKDKPQDFAEVATGNTFLEKMSTETNRTLRTAANLEGLFARFIGCFVDDDVVFGTWKMLVLKRIERTLDIQEKSL
jgi:hypothetical protein